MNKLILIGIMCLSTLTAQAEPLDKATDTRTNWIRITSALDAATTIIGVGKGLVESNAILGVAPEPVTVITYFVARQVLIEYITPRIQEQWQSTWQMPGPAARGLPIRRIGVHRHRCKRKGFSPPACPSISLPGA